jgi:hypothetical protein
MSRRRSPTTSSARVVGSADKPSTQIHGRVLFVTGRLAEPALRRVLADMAPPFTCDVAVLGITVAALMTTAWIATLRCRRTDWC